MKQQKPNKERTGWWKFARSMQDKEELWGTTTGWVWLTILNNANYNDSSYMGVKVDKGQCIISVRGLAEELKTTRERIETSLLYLERNNRIKLEKGVERRFSIVTVLNWTRYQGENEVQKVNSKKVKTIPQTIPQTTPQTTPQNADAVAGISSVLHPREHPRLHPRLHPYQRSIKNSKEVSTTDVVLCEVPSLSEDDIAETHIEAETEAAPKPKRKTTVPPCPRDEIASLYNQTCTNLSPCKSITSKERRQLLFNAWRWANKVHPEDPMGKLREVFVKSNADDFMQRKAAPIEWVLKRSNLDRIEEQREGLIPSQAPKSRRASSALEANMELINQSNEWSRQEVERIRRELAEMEGSARQAQPAPALTGETDYIEVQYEAEEAY